MAENKPVHTVQVGAIRASVWKNDGKKGTWFNTTISRVYRDEKEELRDTNSYGTSDLLAVGKVADLAHTWCLENRDAE